MSSDLLKSGIVSFAILSLVPVVSGQQLLWQRDADEQTSSFGIALAFTPDQNGDGIDDLLAGYPGGDCSPSTGSLSGIVYLLSGVDGSEVWNMCGGDVDGDGGFGDSLAVMPDLDADGVFEFVVGGSTYDGNHSYMGAVFLYSGATLLLIRNFGGEDQDNRFGTYVCRSADLDADGFDDFIVAAPSYSWAYPLSAGRTYVYSSQSGTLLRTQQGEKDLDDFGKPCCLPDIDGDGVSDYMVASSLTATSDFGQVELFSGATGAVLYQWDGDHNGGFATSLASAGDLTGDGVPDVLVGGAGDQFESGYVYCYSGGDGAECFCLRGDRVDDKFGVNVASVGDMNDDGVPEFLVGAYMDDLAGMNAGYARLFSGRTARTLYTFFPSDAQIAFGSVVAGGSDLNGDRIPDILIRAAYTPPFKGKRMGGRITAFAGNDLFLQTDNRSPLPGDVVTIETRGGESGALTLLALIDLSGTPMFVPLVVSTLDSNGESALVATIPAAASGLDFTLLAYAQKHAGGHGLIDSWTEVISVQ
jgi:hypothetical protein